MKYNLYWINGGHAGPFADFEIAYTMAKQILTHEDTILKIEIRPDQRERFCEFVPEFTENNPTSSYLWKQKVGEGLHEWIFSLTQP